MEKEIKELIEKLRVYIQMDGGDIEFVGYEDYYVYVRLSGNCTNCLMQDNTINNSIFNYLKEDIPEIEGVINIPI